MEIGATTRLLVLLGDPVRHSLSPAFQNAAIRAAGLDAVYAALPCHPTDFRALLPALARAGAAGNVTLPHKTSAASLLDVPTSAVQRTGACNTFWSEGGRLHGDNTDVEGFTVAARSLVELAGARTLVLGAGGAARAVVVALLEQGGAAVHVLNRSPGRAAELRDSLDPSGETVAVLERPDDAGTGYDLLVNATSVGLRTDDPSPLALDPRGRTGAVLDLTYRADPSALVTAARSAGIPAADGREMLIQQGAASFRRWFGRDPDLGVMRRALEPRSPAR